MPKLIIEYFIFIALLIGVNFLFLIGLHDIWRDIELFVALVDNSLFRHKGDN